jgi:ABC-type oligopeptide transport system substrate-binding subunit
MSETAPLRPNDPERIGAYQLTGRLGEGGQGIVYLATGPAGESVAVKLLHAQFSGDAKARARFAGELASAKRVAPFCTAQILDADVEGDTPYLVSEFIEGPSLREVVDARGPSSGGDLQRLAIGTVTALTAIHEAGIVHRDFKPTNVLLAADGPRVIDFGISRALDAGGTMTSTTVGTPSYMSPEQISGEPAGPPTDVFAWACTMVFAATGTPPFGQDSIPAVMNRILHQDPGLGMLMGPLREIVIACLAKFPNRRPTAQQVLLRLLGNEGVVLPGAPGGGVSPANVLNQGAQVASEAPGAWARLNLNEPGGDTAPPASGTNPPALHGPGGDTPPPSAYRPGGDTPPPGAYRPGGNTAPPGLYPGGNTAPPGLYPGGDTAPPGMYQPGGHTPFPSSMPGPGPYGPRRRRVHPGVLAGSAAALALLVAVGVVAVVRLTGDHHSKHGPTPVAGKVGGTFRVSMFTPTFIDPSNAVASPDFFVVENLFTGLTRVRTDGTVVPALATSAVPSGGCTQWRFTIKRGTTFSDGQPVDAAAFARGWNRVARNTEGGEGYLMNDVQGYDEVVAGNATTLRGVTASSPDMLQVTLTKPDCDFENRVATPVFSPAPPSAGEHDNATYDRTPIGNGPFKVASYDPRSGLSLVRNPAYAFARPKLDAVDVTFATDAQSAMSGFDSGRYDWTELQSTTVAAARSAHASDGELVRGDIDGMTYLLPIGDNGAMKSKEARQAVSYALDRAAISSSVYEGMYAPANSMVPPAIPGAYEKGCTACVNNPALAKQLAAQAGLGPGSKVTLSIADSPTYTPLATIVQQQLATALGWKVELRKVDPPKIFHDEAGKDAKDLYPYSWLADYPSQESFLYSLLSSDSIARTSGGSVGGGNYARYSSPAFDAALNGARSTTDPGLRTQRLRAAEKIALDDMALIPLYSHTVYRLARTKDFVGMDLDYIGYPNLTTSAHR